MEMHTIMSWVVALVSKFSALFSCSREVTKGNFAAWCSNISVMEVMNSKI